MISIDIETTGLDPEVHQILEFAAVLENGETFHALIGHENYVISEYCLGLHKNLLSLCVEKGGSIHALGIGFRNWLNSNKVEIPYDVVGANFGGFDGRFLRRVPKFPMWNYRILEIGSLYFDGERPRPLNDIEPSTIPHRALPDAEAVMRAYLGKRGKKYVTIPVPEYVLNTGDVPLQVHENGDGKVALSADVHPTTIVHKDAYVWHNCKIGAFCVVEEGTFVPEGTFIGPNTRISND